MPDLPLRPELIIFEDPEQRRLEVRLQADLADACATPGPARSLHRAGASRLRVVARCPPAVLRKVLADRVGPYDQIALHLPDDPLINATLRECRSVLVKCSHAATRLALVPPPSDAPLPDGPPSDAPLPAPVATAGAPALGIVVEEIARAIAALARLTQRRPREHLRLRWQEPGSRAKGPRRVAVAGAGIAGVTIALELLARGHQVLLIEAGEQILSASSAQPWLACHPQFSRRPDLLGMLSQLALQWTLDSPYADLFERRGRFTPALDAAQAREMQSRVERLALDPSLLRFINPLEAVEHAHWPAAGAGRIHGGLWCALGASLEVRRLRQRVLEQADACGDRLQVMSGTRLLGISAASGLWQLETDCRGRLASDALVMAAGAESAELLARLGPVGALGGEPGWQLIAGQTFRVNGLEPGRRDAAATLGGALTLQRLAGGEALVGSSYYEPDRAPEDFSQWQALKARLDTLPGLDTGAARLLSGHAGLRAYVRDRMPMIGPLATGPLKSAGSGQTDGPPQPGAYLAAGFGSRGLLWAHLAAGLIADHLEARMPVLGLKALESLDPCRHPGPTAPC